MAVIPDKEVLTELFQYHTHYRNELPVSTLMDKIKFRDIIHQVVANDLPLYVDLFLNPLTITFDYKAFGTDRNFLAVHSNLNLIDFLPDFIRRTHRFALPDYVMGAVSQHLGKIMASYDPLIKKQT